MSERIEEWIPVAVVATWSTGVAIQASSAIYAWWTKPRNVWDEWDDVAHRNRIEKQLRSSKYEKIMRGEKANGWKSCRFDSISDSSRKPYYQMMLPPWPKDGSDAPVDTSVLVVMIERTPNGNYEMVYIIRRYSLIAPGIYDDIAQIYYDFRNGWWSPQISCYVNENVVASVWKQPSTDGIRIVLVNINSKSYQILETTSPISAAEADISPIFVFSIVDRLAVLFEEHDEDEDDGNVTFHLIEYGISPSESIHSPIVHQLASRRLDWRQGNWTFAYSNLRGGYQGSQYPGDFGFMYSNNHDANHHRVVLLDRYGFHDLDGANEWRAKFGKTALGSRIAEAWYSLKTLLPNAISISMYELHRSHLFAYVHSRYITHRPLNPPSLLYLAAEAFCMANPNFDFATLKHVIGFDIFDGIFDEKKPAVIRM